MVDFNETKDALIGIGYDEEEASKIARARMQVCIEMQNGISEFSFIKKDGTIRTARGTLKDVPYEFVESEEESANKTPVLVQRYFDVDKQSWRSFKVEKLI